MATRECPICLTVFDLDINDFLFCSPECKRSSYRRERSLKVREGDQEAIREAWADLPDTPVTDFEWEFVEGPIVIEKRAGFIGGNPSTPDTEYNNVRRVPKRSLVREQNDPLNQVDRAIMATGAKPPPPDDHYASPIMNREWLARLQEQLQGLQIGKKVPD
jgi:hypothetical protein